MLKAYYTLRKNDVHCFAERCEDVFLPRITVIRNDFVCMQVKLVGKFNRSEACFRFPVSIISTTLTLNTAPLAQQRL